mgnify:CR=1 FL=1
MKKRKQNDLLIFFGGLAMMVAGLYWFMSKVTVASNFFGGSLRLGGFSINSGLVVVPFIAAVIWLFTKPDSFFAKIGVGLSVILIIAAVILNTSIYLRPTSLYEYLLMIVFILAAGLWYSKFYVIRNIRIRIKTIKLHDHRIEVVYGM